MQITLFEFAICSLFQIFCTQSSSRDTSENIFTISLDLQSSRPQISTNMASVIVVENDLKDSVNEYSQIIDGVHQNTEFSASLSAFLPEGSATVTNPTELASAIFAASTKETLTSLSDKEFEPAFYLLVFLLTKLENQTIEQLTTQDSKIISLLKSCTPTEQPSLRDRRSLKPTTILSIFNTLFNLLPASSSNRIQLINSILAVVAETNTSFAFIQSSIGHSLVSWLKDAGASEAEIKQIFWFFITLDTEFTLESLQLIKTFTTQFQLSIEELRTLITFALSSSVVDVSFLVNNNVATALSQNSSDELVQTFVQYTHSDLISTVPESLPESIKHKSKILCLAKFFVENGTKENNNTFKYSDIPSALASSPADFEKLLVDSIKAGVIEGKLNQVEETFFSIRTNRCILAGDDNKLAQDWDTVKAALMEWKHSLENINEVVLNAKENIVNNNNAN
ncbi:hypothetical protein PUMCH_004402 [Australozyma saopauloensis]|uniref:PCI domain-containing protein n=1 Tax=Australozyma saopauloensis TaxID=291208 RepID=A0AAX4HF54_9ASCO|nr:hypothetical protein PUMCH_004402 [[Candida] saopauloensis]